MSKDILMSDELLSGNGFKSQKEQSENMDKEDRLGLELSKFLAMTGWLKYPETNEKKINHLGKVIGGFLYRRVQ